MIERGLHVCSVFLLRTLRSFMHKKQIELYRVAEVASVLLMTGFSEAFYLFDDVVNVVLGNQRKDGGWTDVKESLWCLIFLKLIGVHSDRVSDGLRWLLACRNASGGWGENARDFSRIPLTSLMLLFHHEIVSADDIRWLISKVNEDLLDSFFLTYKVSLPLIALQQKRYKSFVDLSQINSWEKKVRSQQNDDGGFSPWKGHPSGSDIVSSGYAFLSLGKSDGRLCLDWILKNQLENGAWPYHYIEHGACVGMLALAGANVFSLNRANMG